MACILIEVPYRSWVEVPYSGGNNRHDHYENMPMQYTEIFKVVKNENFQ